VSKNEKNAGYRGKKSGPGPDLHCRKAGVEIPQWAWLAWLPGLDFGTKCKKIRRISQISYCQWSTDGRTLALL
jgi:hypothetical protein